MTADARQKVLLITRNLPPLVGGMERLNWHMADELSRHAQVQVIGPRGAAALKPVGVTLQEVPLKPLWRFLLQAQWRALQAARHWRPHIVLAGSGLTAPLALIAARACGAQAVTYVHGLDIAIRHPVYRALWLPALRRMDRIIANSSATRQLAVAAGVAPERISIVHPGVALPRHATDPPAAQRFRDQHGFGQRPILLSVGRLTQRKGLQQFVTDVLPTVAAKHPDVLLVVIGDAPSDALHAESQSPQSIQAAAAKVGVNNNLQFLGHVREVELVTAYGAANVHVFPIKTVPGDIEGFGMVAIEAAAHGLSTVAYATGGVVDAVADHVSGRLITPGDSHAFAQAIISQLNNPTPPATLRRHAEQFAWPQFGSLLWSSLNQRGQVYH